MKKLKLLLITILMNIASGQVLGGVAEHGPWNVSSLRFGTDGLYVQFSPPPASCDGGDQYRMHAKVPATRANYKELASALLTSYTANQQLKYIWVDNIGTCSSAHILELYMIEYMPK